MAHTVEKDLNVKRRTCNTHNYVTMDTADETYIHETTQPLGTGCRVRDRRELDYIITVLK